MTYFDQPLPQQAAKKYAIGYASGYFDLFHVGHLRYLQLAAQFCDKLIVGIPNDQIVRADARPKPFTPFEQRRAIVAELRCVHEVVSMAVSMEHAEYFLHVMKEHGVEALLIGGDWSHTERWNRLGPLAQAAGLDVHFLPRTEGISSTWIRHQLAGSVS
jgi:glycerol-3-phosphate cytidylyltransferase